MTLYTVHEPSAGFKDDMDRYVQTSFIPEAKSLIALALPLPWLLWNRMWWAALFYLLITAILSLALATDLATLAFLLTAIPGIFLFLEGNELRRKDLMRDGWTFVCTVEGDDQQSAELRYFHSLEYRRSGAKPEPVTPKMYQVNPEIDAGIEFLASPQAD